MEMERKSKLKGFTLVELLVVMAIFSVLMAAALALTTPVSRMYKNTSLSEKTYSYSHNIQECIQGTLEYADSLYVYTSDKLGTYATDPKTLAEEFRATHYNNVVLSRDGSTSKPVMGKIYIMRLLNNPATIDGVDYPAGQIVVSEYPFENNALTTVNTYYKTRALLNDSYFNSSDSKYSFSYALGASKLVGVTNPSGTDSGDYYKALKSDKENTDNGVTAKTLSLSIVLDRDTSNNGYVDVGGATGYRAFKAPVAVQIANLPLTNINSRGMNPKGMPRIIPDPSSSKLRYQKTDSPNETGDGFRAEFNTKVDFNNDIYFVYAYADELK